MGCSHSSQSKADLAKVHICEPVKDIDATFDDLENFVQLCVYRGNKIQAVTMFLTNPDALTALIRFLNREDQFYSHFYADNCRILREIVKASSEYAEITDSVKLLVGKYIRNRSQSSAITPASDSVMLKLLNAGSIKKPDTTTTATTNNNNNNNDENSPNSTNQTVDPKDVLLESNEVIAMTAVQVLPKFLLSTQYQNWRDMEAINGYSNFSLPLLQLLESKSYTDDNLKVYLKSSYKGLGSYTQRAFASLDPLEMKNIAKSHYLSTFLGAVEGLPMCVSISTANQDRRGFPLIYVNHVFEETTGYSRKDIVGRNCSFLQGECTEPESIAILCDSLRTAVSCKVVITNYRKNGERFTNLLAMKPLFDADGAYAFVIGLQFDVSTEKAKYQNLEIIDDLLGLLPDRLPTSD